MIDTLMAKAHQALETGQRDFSEGDHDASVNRSYYAVYYAAWAMFVAHGIDKPKTHSGMISEFSRRFVKEGIVDQATGATLGKLENLRCYADYTLDTTPADKARLALESATLFVGAIESRLRDLPGRDGSI